MNKMLAILTGMVIPLISCSENDEVRLGPAEITLTPEQVALIEGSNRFGLDLFSEVLSEEGENENVFISPLSVHLALSMAWNGADGATREEIMKTLGYPEYDDETINEAIKKLIDDLLSVDNKVETGIANSVWYRDTYPVEQDFLDLNNKYFGAEISPLDFNKPGAKDIINAWVARQTNDRIKEIVDRIDHDHIMFLINAIYFKGVWTREFVPENTKKRPFNLYGGGSQEVMTMETEGDFGYAGMDGYGVAELPYGRGNYSMLLFLPDEGFGVNEMIGRIDAGTWEDLPGKLENKQKLLLRLPKFTVEYDTNLNGALRNLGIKDAFAPRMADFTRINKNGELYVSRVRHKTFVEVNEEGTEAAAVTSVDIRLVSYDPDEPQVIVFDVDRPFVFAIKEKFTNSLVFIGRIMEP